MGKRVADDFNAGDVIEAFQAFDKVFFTLFDFLKLLFLSIMVATDKYKSKQ
jgi:hypothetical protein